MRMGKRVLSLLVMLCMLVGLLPTAALAASSSTSPVFTDVQESDWYYEAAYYAYEHGIMSGTGQSQFSPNAATTRGMVVTILYSMEGKPEVSENRFSDVRPDQYFANAVNWASEHGIVSGYGHSLFGPNDLITREQLAVILYGYAKYKGYDVSKTTDLSAFQDVGSISAYAVQAMQWAVASGLISGMGDGMLSPQGSATRGQVCVIMMQYSEKVVTAPTTEGEKKPDSSDSSGSSSGGSSGGGGSSGDSSTTYTVTFHTNCSYVIEAQQVEAGKTAVRPADPVRFGYRFDGWYQDEALTTVYDFATPVSQSLTLYAKWTAQELTGEDSMLNPDPSATGAVSRRQWIETLVDKLELTVDSSDLSSSFADLEYNVKIEAAVQNGVILSTGAEDTFSPSAPATTAFAAVTTVRALGYSCQTLQDYIVIAEDMALVEGVGNTINLTLPQCSQILNVIDTMLQSTEIDPNFVPVMDVDAVILEPSVTYEVLPQAAALTQTAVQTAQIRVDAAPEALGLQAGQTVLLPVSAAFPGGLAQKIVQVTGDGSGKTLLTTQTPTLNEFLGESGRVAAQKEIPTGQGNFQVAEELAQNTPVLSRSRAAEGGNDLNIYAVAQQDALVVVLESANENGFFHDSSRAEVKITYPTIRFIADVSAEGTAVKTNALYLSVGNQVDITGGFRDNVALDVELGRISVPVDSWFTVDLVVRLTVDSTGEVTLNYTMEHMTGVQLVNGHVRGVSSSATMALNSFQPLDCTVQAGPATSAVLTLAGVFDLADFGTGTGLGISGEKTARENGEFCVDSSVYAYRTLSAFEYGILGSPMRWDLWDQDNSVFSRGLHFEYRNGTFQQEPVCTYGEGSIYGTVTNIAGDAVTGFDVYCTTEDTAQPVEIDVTLGDAGRFTISNMAAGTYLFHFTAPGYQLATQKIEVLANRTTNVGTIYLITDNDEMGTGSGYLNDALTGGAVADATIELYAGYEAAGDPIYTITSDTQGRYSFHVMSGSYTVHITKEGYTERTGRFYATVPEMANQNFVMIPEGLNDVEDGTSSQIGDLRIVLRWGETPRDLDSHLCGPTASGTDRFHVYYANRNYYENETVHSFLDHDDVTSYGPETTTVYNIKSNGKYSFYVHDFTNAWTDTTTALSESGAFVEVFTKEATGQVNANGEELYRSKLIATLYVPTKQEGTLWHVFDYNAATGELTASDDMLYVRDSGNVGQEPAVVRSMENTEDTTRQTDLQLICESIQTAKE